MDIDNQIAELKRRIQVAQLRRAKLEVNKESAQALHESTRSKLREIYQVDTADGVRAKLAELQSDLADRLSEVESILSKHNL